MTMPAAPTAPQALAERLLPTAPLARAVSFMLMALLGTLVLWASAKIKVPFLPVPMTLQTLAVLGLAATLGLRLGLATILLYLAEGAMGLPVFTDTPEKGLGLAYMAGPTGGYLLGFVVMTAIVGYAADRGWGRSVPKLFGAMLVGDAAMLGLGFLWLATLIGPDKAWAFGVAPFLLGDLVKLALAALLVPAATRALRR